MTARLVVAFVILLCVGGFGLAGAINAFAIIEAVNAKLPAEDQFDPFWWYPPKTLRLHEQYRRLFPDGGLVRRQGILTSIMLLCIVLAAGLLGFGLLSIAWLGLASALLIWVIYFRK